MTLQERDDAGSLESALARGPLAVERAVRLATDVLAELAHRHAAGRVHGAVGARAVRLAGGRAHLEEAGEVRPQELAPELLEGGPPSVSSDLFAVGILIYRALTGEFPFPGQNLTEVVDSHLSGPVSLRARNPRVPPALATVIECALSRRVAGRPQSAAELAAHLREAAATSALVVEEPPAVQAPPGRLPLAEQVLFDRFLVLGVMSQRGWDVMYLVKELAEPGRLLTMRVGRPEMPHARALLEHEVEVVRSIRNAHVVRVLDHGVSGGLAWTLYQPLRGTTLRTRLHSGALDPEEAVVVILQILEALRAVHAAGWVHRDVKPENILEEAVESYRLAGFDVAARPGTSPGDRPVITEAPGYGAPETQGGGEIGPAADLFSAGVVLHELLTGHPPVTLEPPPPLPRSTDMPSHLEAALARALAKDPAARYPDAMAMRLAILGVEGPECRS